MLASARAKRAQEASQELNADCWERVLSKLDSVDAAKFALVSREWRALSLKSTAKVLQYDLQKPFGTVRVEEEGDSSYAKLIRQNRIASGLRAYIERRKDSLEIIDIHNSASYLSDMVLEAVVDCQQLRVLTLCGWNHNQSLDLPRLPASLRVLKVNKEIAGFAMYRIAVRSSLRVFECKEIRDFGPWTSPIPMDAMSNLHTLKFEAKMESYHVVKQMRILGKLMHVLQILHIKFSGEAFIEADQDDAPFSQVLESILCIKTLRHLTMESVVVSEPCDALMASHQNLKSIHLLNTFCCKSTLSSLLKCPLLKVLDVTIIRNDPRTERQVFPQQGFPESNLQMLRIYDWDNQVDIDLPMLLSLPRLKIIVAYCRLLPCFVSLKSEIESLQIASINLSAVLDYTTRSILTSSGLKSFIQATNTESREHLVAERMVNSCNISNWEDALRERNILEDLNYSALRQFSVLLGLHHCQSYKEGAVYQKFIEMDSISHQSLSLYHLLKD